MPLFFFDVSGANVTPPTEGLSFVSLEHARAHAATLLPVIGIDLPKSAGEFRSWKVTVRDEADEVVCRFIVAIINDDLSEGSNRLLQPAGG